MSLHSAPGDPLTFGTDWSQGADYASPTTFPSAVASHMMEDKIPETMTRYLDSFSNGTSRNNCYFPELSAVEVTLVP